MQDKAVNIIYTNYPAKLAHEKLFRKKSGSAQPSGTLGRNGY
jgi:hypothetical protein